jgi:hypothetical protein
VRVVHVQEAADGEGGGGVVEIGVEVVMYPGEEMYDVCLCGRQAYSASCSLASSVYPSSRASQIVARSIRHIVLKFPVILDTVLMHLPCHLHNFLDFVFAESSLPPQLLFSRELLKLKCTAEP